MNINNKEYIIKTKEGQELLFSKGYLKNKECLIIFDYFKKDIIIDNINDLEKYDLILEKIAIN